MLDKATGLVHLLLHYAQYAGPQKEEGEKNI